VAAEVAEEMAAESLWAEELLLVCVGWLLDVVVVVVVVVVGGGDEGDSLEAAGRLSAAEESSFLVGLLGGELSELGALVDHCGWPKVCSGSEGAPTKTADEGLWLLANTMVTLCCCCCSAGCSSGPPTW